MSRPKQEKYVKVQLHTINGSYEKEVKVGTLTGGTVVGDYLSDGYRFLLVERQLPEPKPRQARKAAAKPKASGKALDPEQDFAQPHISGGE